MENEITILIAEDDEGHAALIKRNLKRAGILNKMHRFKDGAEVIHFLMDYKEKQVDTKLRFLLLLDIRMPKMDGIEVLQKLKADHKLKKMPVIIVTTTDDPREIELCYDLGCSSYVRKPVDYDQFIRAIQNLGMFLKVVSVPKINKIKGLT